MTLKFEMYVESSFDGVLAQSGHAGVCDGETERTNTQQWKQMLRVR